MPQPTAFYNQEAVLIKHHGMWWRPLGHGYTNDLLDAGIFSPFVPWRDDTLVSLHKHLATHPATEAEKAVMIERAEKAITEYSIKMQTQKIES